MAASINNGNFLFTIFNVIMMQAASLLNRATKDKFKAAIDTINASSSPLGQGNYGVICLIDENPGDSSVPAKLLKVSAGSTSLALISNLSADDWSRTFEMTIDYTPYLNKDAMFVGLTANTEVYYARHIDNSFIQATNGVSMDSALRTAGYIEVIDKYGTEDKIYGTCNVPRIEQFTTEPHAYGSLTNLVNPWINENPSVTGNLHNRYCVACSTTTANNGPYYLAFGAQGSDLATAITPSFQLQHMSTTPGEGDPETGIAFQNAELYYKIAIEGGSVRMSESSASEIGEIAVNRGPVYISAYWVDSEGVVLHGSQMVLDGVTTTDDRDVTLSPSPYEGSVRYNSSHI